jgi:hypothetical protein
VTRCAAPAVRRELLRIDRDDAALRARWVASKFADRAIERELDEMGRAALGWLYVVVEEHGWPGRALVGPRAASAAVRLVQHAEHDLAFRRRCLRLVRRAAVCGDLPWHHVANLTDALRVCTGHMQVYGTKFHYRDGVLVPLPIEGAASVDQRRATLGLPPLDVYTRQIRRRFGQLRR